MFFYFRDFKDMEGRQLGKEAQGIAPLQKWGYPTANTSTSITLPAGML